MMKNIPARTRLAPKANSGAGISWKTAMPSIVAPMDSSRAMVAVSKDFRFEREEKYRVCDIAVGIKPKPISGRMISIVVGIAKVFPVVGMMRMPASRAAKK